MCGVFIALILVFGRQLVGIFNPDPAVIAEGYTRICYVISAHLFSISIEVFSGYLRGYGISLPPAVWTFFSIVVVRLAYVFFLYPGDPTFTHLLLVYPITLGLNAAGLIALYFMMRHGDGSCVSSCQLLVARQKCSMETWNACVVRPAMNSLSLSHILIVRH